MRYAKRKRDPFFAARFSRKLPTQGRSRIWGRRVAPKTGYWAGVTALNEVRRLRREEEIKESNHAGNVTMTLNDQWSTAVYINDIDQGTTAATRIGNKIVMKSIQVRTGCRPDAAETTIGGFRWALVFDRRPRGALAAGANQIFNGTNTQANIQSADPEYAGRFQILHDENINWDALPDGVEPRDLLLDPVFIKRNLKTEYNSTGGGIADCQKGSLLILACSNNASHDCVLSFNIKIKFADS